MSTVKTDPPPMPESMSLSSIEERQCLALVHDLYDSIRPWLSRDEQTYGPILQALSITLVSVASEAGEPFERVLSNLALLEASLRQQTRRGGLA